MFEIIAEQSQLILTGIFISFLSSLIFRITPTGFVSGGKYRTKQGAIVIYLVAAVILGLLTPVLYLFTGLIMQQVSVLTIAGVLIFCTNFIINQSVPTWRHTTPKTLMIYLFAVGLIFIGFLLKFPQL